MGSAAIITIVVLLIAIFILVIEWKYELRKNKTLWNAFKKQLERAQKDKSDNLKLEVEIQRLRKIPLTQPKEKVDNSVIKAKSAADVRRITESAWGSKPEIGEQK
jgi:hypothetical protein